MKLAALRAAEPLDCRALLDIWVEAWSAAMPDIDFEARRAWFAGRLDELAAAGACTIVATEPDGAIAGFMTLTPTTRYLDQLVVRPAHQGRGLARQMMTEAKRLCPGGLDLHVNEDNVRAMRFYEREGFRRGASGTNPRSGLPIRHMHWPASSHLA